ncbi:uncharacterized protein DFL_001201 [Arthrobotrys flagrans]|uniref:Uncharacterized protein n=1 Tax=Arthrobotrys flagrans TaxID=97331 RepID=A0A437AGF5_ARTFL|nr:hypothetical protein DFL_001201 [Arthrobotrys flagrans]
MLPPSLQKLEMERKMGLWEKTPWGSSGVVSKAKSGAKRLPGLDDEEPTVRALFESSRLPVGSGTVPRIDIRNPITIDPLATKIPSQPTKFLMVRELAELYHKANTEDLARDIWARGGIVGDGMCRKFEREKAEREDPGMRRRSRSTDPIPFGPAPEVTALTLAATPQPQFKFLGLVQAAAPERLPASTTVRPYDWVPMSAGALSSYKTLPAIFWSVSGKEAVSVVFYLFPTSRNISYPVSVGIVEDKKVPNIAVHTVRHASQSLLKVYWSGYIDFSRPMIIPNSSIYSNPSLASVDEKAFWGLWKCLFRQPTFGGHQYGMTKETSAFENPLRLRRAFESSTSFPGKYTAQMALEKLPLHLKNTFSDSTNDSDSDDETVKGCDSEYETDSDDNSMIVPMSHELEDDTSCSDSTEICTDSASIGSLESEAKPLVTNWLDAIFERPSTITLDTSVEITTPKREIQMTKATTQCAQAPLEEVQIKEDGRAIERRRTFEDPEEYKEMESDPNAIEIQQPEELSAFNKGILRLLNMVIGLGGRQYQISSAHTAYLYNYPGVKDTKSFLNCYRKQCIREAQEEEIKEKGFTDLSNGPYMWDDKIHGLRMETELPINDVLRGFRKAYGIPPYDDKYVRRHYRMAVQAKKHGRIKFPVPWVPEPVLAIVEKDEPVKINADGCSISRSISDSSSEEDDVLHEALYGMRILGGKLDGPQAQAPLEKDGDGANPPGHEKSPTKSPVTNPHDRCFPEGSKDNEATNATIVENPKPHFFTECTAGEDDPDSTVKEDEQPSSSVLFAECKANNDSEDNGSSGTAAAENEHLKKSSLFTECSANDDSDDDMEVTKSSLFTECNANDDSDDDSDGDAKISKSTLFTECNANDDSDDDTEISKVSLFIECHANDYSDDDMETLKPSFFTSCNVNDDSDDDKDTQKLATQEEVEIPKPPLFTMCSANDDSDDDMKISKSSFFIECNSNHEEDDTDTQKPATQKEVDVPKSPLLTECAAKGDDENTQKPTALESDDTSVGMETSKSPLLIECDANEDEDDEDTQNLVAKEDNHADAVMKIPKPSLFIECNAYDEEDDEDTQMLTARKPFVKHNPYNDETRSSLSREPSAPPPNDQPSSLSPDNVHAASRTPSDSGSSSAITRAELCAMRRARIDQIGLATGDARSNVPGRRLGSLLRQLSDPNHLQPQSEEQKAIKKPDKIRIPGVFLGDQTTAPRAPAQNFDQPVPTRERLPVRRFDSGLPAIDETGTTETVSTSRQARRLPVSQRSGGETDWSAQMREQGLKRRFESRRRRQEDRF